MPGGRESVVGGEQEANDRSGAFIPGKAAGTDSVHKLLGGDCARVSGGTHEDTAWERIRGEPALVSHGLQWRARYLQDVLSDHRGNTELSR